MSGQDPRLLDCTLRDGGYYNDWDFSRGLIQRYLNATHRAGVDVVELGFRSPLATTFKGPTFYTTDAFIDSLDVPTSLTLGVMVNAKDLVGGAGLEFLDSAFAPKERSRVDLVRIAANDDELAALDPAVDRLCALGYDVGVNLMQVTRIPPAALASFADRCSRWGIAVAYVADSFGGLRPKEVRPLLQPLLDGFDGPVGCHLHDNMTYGLANAMEALDAGVGWLDATLLGMGRGPGNVRTEYLALELAQRGRGGLDVVPLIELLAKDFAELQREHGWGSNLYYFLSAMAGTHPTYVMELVRDPRFGPDDIVHALDTLRMDGGAARFQIDRMNGSRNPDPASSSSGTFALDGWCAGRDVVLVGPGADLQRRRVDIEGFIRDHSPVVLGMNASDAVDLDLIDHLVVCHPTRAAIDAQALRDSDKSIFGPRSLLRDVGVEEDRVLDVGVAVTPGVLSWAECRIEIPSVLVAAYALGICAAGRARRILLAGFDGFDEGDPRQAEMLAVFEAYERNPGAPPVYSLTRSRYPLEHRSIYGPERLVP